MISTKQVSVKCFVKRPKEEKQEFAAKVSVCLDTEFGFETEFTRTSTSKILS